MVVSTISDVVSAYRLFLGRDPDTIGLESFSNLISNGGYPSLMLGDLFFNSPEAVALRASRQNLVASLVNIEGFSMWTIPDWNDINRSIAAGAYEPHVTAFFKEWLKPDMAVADIGANVGYFSMLSASMGATVHAFEPNGRNVWLLNRNSQIYPDKINIYPYALGEQNRLVYYNANLGNGQIAEVSDIPPSDEQAVLRLETLDRLLDKTSIDLIKIDVEGAEALVLSGAARVLTNKPVIVSEFTPASLSQISGVSGHDYLQFLVDRGYQIHVLQKSGQRFAVSVNEMIELSSFDSGNNMDILAIPI